MEWEGWAEQEAEEWMETNVVSAWMGENEAKWKSVVDAATK